MTTEDTTPHLWTVEELAAAAWNSKTNAAGVTTGYIRRLLIAGTIRGHKLGDIWVIDDPEARRFLATRKRDEPPNPGG